jgi:hypothetical protein
MVEELVVKPGGVTASEIQAAWTEILAEAGEPGSAVHALLVEHGVDPRAFAAAKLAVDEVDGDGGLSVAIAIATPLAAQVLKDLWQDHVRPRIRKRTKQDAGDPVE